MKFSSFKKYCSFYSTHRKVGYASYIPRIRLPTKALTSLNSDRVSIQEYSGSPVLGHCHFALNSSKLTCDDSAAWPTSIYDFDDYDEKVFKIPGAHSTLKKRLQSKKSPLSDSEFSKIFLRQNSEPEMMNQSTFSDPTGGVIGNSNLANISSDRTSLILPMPSSSCSSAITIPTGRKFKQRDNFYSSSFGALNIESKQLQRIEITAQVAGTWYSCQCNNDYYFAIMFCSKAQNEYQPKREMVY